MINLFRKKTQKQNSSSENNGVIGEYLENGFPVIVKYVNELPTKDIVSKMPWFTVISWNYDGSQNNGMPSDSINQRMIILENALDKAFGKNKISKHAFNRTGNNLKEFNYYIVDRDKFMAKLNSALARHKRYPIEVNFFKDPEWTEMSKLIADFDSKL